MTFPAKTPDEIKLVTFEFEREMADGSTLSNPAVEVTVASGTGADIADITVGTPTVDGTTVWVLISDGISGGKYRLSCTVDASNGEHHQIDKDLPVKDKAAVV